MVNAEDEDGGPGNFGRGSGSGSGSRYGRGDGKCDGDDGDIKAAMLLDASVGRAADLIAWQRHGIYRLYLC